MPELFNGFQWPHWVRYHRPDIRVILTSGCRMASDQAKASPPSCQKKVLTGFASTSVFGDWSVILGVLTRPSRVVVHPYREAAAVFSPSPRCRSRSLERSQHVFAKLPFNHRKTRLLRARASRTADRRFLFVWIPVFFSCFSSSPWKPVWSR